MSAGVVVVRLIGKTCRPSIGGSRRRETAQRPELRASTALGGTRRSAACARKCFRERVREFYGLLPLTPLCLVFKLRRWRLLRAAMLASVVALLVAVSGGGVGSGITSCSDILNLGFLN